MPLIRCPRGTFYRSGMGTNYSIIEIANVEFIVRRRRLCQTSTCFDRAMNGGFQEAHSGVVQLSAEDIDVDILEIFLTWATESPPTGFSFEPAETLDVLIEMYILGDYFDSFDFRFQVHHAVIELCFERPHPVIPSIDNIKRTVTDVPSTLPLRTLMFRAVANAPEYTVFELLRAVMDFDAEFCSSVIEARQICRRLGPQLQNISLPRPRWFFCFLQIGKRIDYPVVIMRL